MVGVKKDNAVESDLAKVNARKARREKILAEFRNRLGGME